MHLRPEEVSLQIRGNVAVITIQRGKANAMTQETYALLAQRLREADAAKTLITVVTGAGRFFSAGADVKATMVEPAKEETLRVALLQKFGPGTLDIVKAFSEHTKILVCALNGPAVGLSAGLLGHMDFIVAQEGAYIFTPFTSLGLTAEGGSSLLFAQRMGLTLAKEVLFFGKRLDAAEMKSSGFANEVFPKSSDFLDKVVEFYQEKFDGLDEVAVLGMKQIINSQLPDRDVANIKETLKVVEAFESGRSSKAFERLAAKL